jgi:hypothetical protein
MDIFFADPKEIPLPSDEVRIRQLQAEPAPDGSRVRVYLEVNAFQKRPSVELDICDAHGDEVAFASIIESMTSKMEIVMHLRGAGPDGDYTLHASLYYASFDEQADPGSTNPPVERKVVDEARVKFTIAPR